jgi:hypothetical protein
LTFTVQTARHFTFEPSLMNLLTTSIVQSSVPGVTPTCLDDGLNRSVISWYLYHLSFQTNIGVLNLFLCVYIICFLKTDIFNLEIKSLIVPVFVREWPLKSCFVFPLLCIFTARQMVLPLDLNHLCFPSHYENVVSECVHCVWSTFCFYFKTDSWT